MSSLLAGALALGPLAREARGQGGAETGAAPPSTAASASAAPASADEAKRYFEEGESLRAAGKYQAALEAYQKSRALLPRASNTIDVAVCLFHLDRLDEAYDYFEEALTKFPETSLPKDARDSAKASMATIEAKVGRVQVSANVDGTLVIDGRARGRVPLAAPVRLMPGKHVVRVLRDGFETFEGAIDVTVGATTAIDAKLAPLTSAGRLRVEADAELAGAIVSIDGAAVGSLPWEGTLAPGTHVCIVRRGDTGSAPTLANVIVGQTVKVVVVARPLGPERRIVVDPPTADLAIDGVAVGKGRFQARLPLGAHIVEAREPGYVAARRTIDVNVTDSSDVTLPLAVDQAHPRWRSGRAPGRFGAELFGGPAFASSFGNDASWCLGTSACPRTAKPIGFRAGVAGTYELANGLTFHARLGWLQFEGKLARRYLSSFTDRGTGTPVATVYNLIDDVTTTGGFAGLGIGYRWKLGSALDISGRLFIDAASVGARDVVVGTGSGGGNTLAVDTAGSGVTTRGLLLEASPEIAVGASFGALRLSLGAAFPISLIDGPQVPLKETTVNDSRANRANTRAIDVAPAITLATSLHAYSRFVSVVPQASVGWWF